MSAGMRAEGNAGFPGSNAVSRGKKGRPGTEPGDGPVAPASERDCPAEEDSGPGEPGLFELLAQHGFEVTVVRSAEGGPSGSSPG